MYSPSAGHVRMKSPFNATNAYTSSVTHAKSGICCGPESVRYMSLLYQNSWKDRAGFSYTGYSRLILHYLTGIQAPSETRHFFFETSVSHSELSRFFCFFASADQLTQVPETHAVHLAVCLWQLRLVFLAITRLTTAGTGVTEQRKGSDVPSLRS